MCITLEACKRFILRKIRDKSRTTNDFIISLDSDFENKCFCVVWNDAKLIKTLVVYFNKKMRVFESEFDFKCVYLNQEREIVNFLGETQLCKHHILIKW